MAQQTSATITTDRGEFEPLPKFAEQFTYTTDDCQQLIRSILLQVNATIEEKMLQRAADARHRMDYDRTAVALLNLEISLLEFQEHPYKNGFGVPADLPPAIFADAQRMDRMLNVLYRNMSSKEWAEFWAAHALCEGNGGVHMADAERDFAEHMTFVKSQDETEEMFYWAHPHDITRIFRAARLPERVSVKSGGRTRKGWDNVNYDPERALRAILALAVVKMPGALVVKADREALYEIELERRVAEREAHLQSARSGV